MKIDKSTADQLLQALASGEMKVLDQIYDAYRNEFLSWAHLKFPGINRTELLDAWHDTMIMFYESVREGRLTHLTCEIKTYLFLIGHRRLIKLYRKSERIDYVEEIDVNKSASERMNVFGEEGYEEEQRAMMRQAVSDLPDQTRQILVMRFLEGKSIQEIMQSMGYANVNAVSASLSRALKKLKETIVGQTESKSSWTKETRS
ncbi:MAG TPA: sigma-70 family RNA polymerase sigma factor [Saprospiraceae bacterium]|nr:sigma-70 family RNA polymerase sigma factor [Saprospiraceae bacterium]